MLNLSFTLLTICTAITIVLCLYVLFASFLPLLFMGPILLFLFIPGNFLLDPDLINFNMWDTGYFIFLQIFLSSCVGFSEVTWELLWSLLLSFVRYGAGPLEKEMTTHSSILAWKNPWTRSLGVCEVAKNRIQLGDQKTAIGEVRTIFVLGLILPHYLMPHEL